MQEQITQALAALEPVLLEVENESHMHSRGENSHFKAVIVSDAFAGLRKVQRHQRVYGVLENIMPQIHALALHLYTEEEWREVGQAPDSPACRGGSLHDL